ncbi:hypothetical protein NQD34_001604 [Periophthalmus magnuspinnatus]|nr:hypothetical protein NQD34_001604 [Periophthalmus magnuspinnatus]
MILLNEGLNCQKNVFLVRKLSLHFLQKDRYLNHFKAALRHFSGVGSVTCLLYVYVFALNVPECGIYRSLSTETTCDVIFTRPRDMSDLWRGGPTVRMHVFLSHKNTCN